VTNSFIAWTNHGLVPDDEVVEKYSKKFPNLIFSGYIPISDAVEAILDRGSWIR